MSETSIDRMIIPAFEQKHATQTPTAYLRWKDGILEQKWKVTAFNGGVVYEIHFDWMPVPDEDAP